MPTPAEGSLCWTCRTGMSLIAPPFCSSCGLPAAGTVGHEYQCHTCSRHPPRFEVARSVYRFQGPIREAIHSLKYEQALHLEPPLSELLHAGLQALYETDSIEGIVPVPLFRRRYRRRGYNQAQLLAEGLAQRSGLPVFSKILVRIRDTPSQVGLSLAQRRANMRGAFQCRSLPECLQGKRVLLVDDVMTTAATANACSRALRAAGVGRVAVLTLARG